MFRGGPVTAAVRRSKKSMRQCHLDLESYLCVCCFSGNAFCPQGRHDSIRERSICWICATRPRCAVWIRRWRFEVLSSVGWSYERIAATSAIDFMRNDWAFINYGSDLELNVIFVAIGTCLSTAIGGTFGSAIRYIRGKPSARPESKKNRRTNKGLDGASLTE